MSTPIRTETDHAAAGRIRRWRRRIGLLVVAGAVLGLAFATPTGRHQLELSFTRVPAPWVALYFPHDPPAVMTGSHLTVTFTVADHGGGGTRYGYVIRALDAGRPVARGTGTISVDPDATSTTSADLVLPPGVKWTEVDVDLAGRTESLHYTPPASRKLEGR